MAKKGKKAKGSGPLKRLAKCIDLPDFALGLNECIEIWGGNTVRVEGAKGIHTYEAETVKIAMGKYLLVLQGEAFDLTRFDDGVLQVSGKLKNICWEVE